MTIGVIARHLKNLELLASSTSSSGETFEVYRERGTTQFTLRRVGRMECVSWAHSWRQLLALLYLPEVPSGIMAELAWKLFAHGVCKAG
jgi:hypothetical protein